MSAPTWPRDQFRTVFEAARDAAGFRNNSAVAEAAGINSSTVSNWFNPRKSMRPTHDTLSAVAAVLKISVIELWQAAGLIDPVDLRSADTALLQTQVRTLTDQLAAATALIGQFPGPDPHHRCPACGQNLPNEAARWLAEIHERLASEAVTWQELYIALGVEGSHLQHVLAGRVPLDEETAGRLLAAGTDRS